MSSSDVTVTLDSRVLDRLISDLRPETERIVSEAAHGIEADAKDRAPIDTGNLVASITARRVDGLNWEVAALAEYAAHVELGTRRTAAQPFLFPAATAAEPRLEAAIAALIARGGR